MIPAPPSTGFTTATNPCLRWTDSQQHHNVYYLSMPETIIGRRSGADLVINELNVSRRHFGVAKDGDGYKLRDMGSTLGTYVNGHQVDECQLHHGDRIRFGPDGIEVVYLVKSASGDFDKTTRAFDLNKSIQGIAALLPSQADKANDLEKLTCLLDLHFNWGQSFSPGAAFQTILKSAMSISAAERGFILIRDTGGFRFEAGLDGSGATLKQSDFQTSQSVVEHVASTREPVLMTQQIDDQFAAQKSVVAMHLHAVACLPLIATLPGMEAPDLMGILYLDSRKPMQALSVLDRRIMTTLAEQAGAVLEKLAMIKTAEEQRKIQHDLIQAREIQRSLLPREAPKTTCYRIHHFNLPTRHVGGDFYDFLALESGELAGVLADVSGKGVPAALLASLVQGALHMEFATSRRCDTVLDRINKLLCMKALPGRFVTMFAAILDPQGVGHYVSAGHNPTYVYRAGSRTIDELPSGGLIVGAFTFATYECAPLTLADGDILVVYSDGLTEAEGPDGEMFGEDRLRQVILDEAGAGCQALERKLLEATELFTRGMAQTDDITFILVEKRPTI